MKTQTIKVEGLPEGWKAVAYRKPLRGDHVFNNGIIKIAPNGMIGCWLIVEKIQPRRIVLEEDINDNRNPSIAQTLKLSSGRIIHIFCPYAVREVKETDIPLTNEDDKLSLSVIELKDISSNAKYIMDKIAEFIKDK